MGLNWRHYSVGMYANGQCGASYQPHPRLLIIDDEQDSADFMLEIANDVDILVRVARKSGDLMSSLVGWQPSIIALDLMVRTRNGLPLLGTLHRVRYPGRIILMSAAEPRHLALAAACAEAGDLRIAAALHKPLRRFEVRAVLERLTTDH